MTAETRKMTATLMSEFRELQLPQQLRPRSTQLTGQQARSPEQYREHLLQHCLLYGRATTARLREQLRVPGLQSYAVPSRWFACWRGRGVRACKCSGIIPSTA